MDRSTHVLFNFLNPSFFQIIWIIFSYFSTAVTKFIQDY